MTRKEKVREIMPDAVSCKYTAGVYACPADYKFLNLPKVRFPRCSMECGRCWNAEWSEPAKPQWQQDILDKFMRVV